MITRALERGVSEERIASTLKVDVQNIRLKRNMLNGICPEAVELLKDKPITVAPLGLLRRVKPARQIEIAEMLNLVGNYGCPYIQALIAATWQEQLAASVTKKPKAILSPESVAQIQREMEALQHELRRHEETYGVEFSQPGDRPRLPGEVAGKRAGRPVPLDAPRGFSGTLSAGHRVGLARRVRVRLHLQADSHPLMAKRTNIDASRIVLTTSA